MRISLFFVCGYLIILLTQWAPKTYYCNQVDSGNIGFSMKWRLIGLESLDQNSAKMEGIY